MAPHPAGGGMGRNSAQRSAEFNAGRGRNASGCFAAAFLIFLSAAARAGVVSTDFGARTCGLGGLGLCGASLVLQLLLLPPLTLLDLARLLLRFSRLDQE